MIVEIDGKRKRKNDFQTFKIKGKKLYELQMFIKNHGYVNILLEHGGKLASSIGTHIGGEEIQLYPVSFAQLPFVTQSQVLEAIQYIEQNGNPVDNDESIYS